MIVVAAPLVLVNVPILRRMLITGPLMNLMKAMKLMPTISETERVALEAGTTCFKSKEYNDAAAFRRANGAGEVQTVVVESGDAT